MTPVVVVALLAGGILLGWVGRSVRAAGREIDLILDSHAWAREATEAWQVIAYLEDENSHVKGDNVRLVKESADQWDDGYLYAANIDARGEVDR